MSMSFAVWLDSLLAVFTKLVGAERTEVLHRGWRLFANRSEAVVSVYGVYDGGKSSLILRFLADDGRPVPEWLVIGGGPSTTEIHEAAGLGCILRDTTGLGTGNPAHDLAAEHALLGADVLLVVLLPNLLTSDRDAILRVLSGQVFHPQGLPYPPGAALVAVSRMDAGPIDPLEDEDEYRGFAEEIRCAAQAQLAALAQVHLPLDAIHTVAPDAGGRVGDRRDARREHYDGSRAWDGMANLSAALAALPAQLPRLREAAGVRYFLYWGYHVLSMVQKAYAAGQGEVQQAQRELEEIQAANKELDGMLTEAKADLADLVEAELLAAARIRGTDVERLRQHLAGKLEAALDRWSQRRIDALADFAERLELQWATRTHRTPAARLAAALDPPSPTETTGSSGSGLPSVPELTERLWKVQKHGQRVLEFAVDASVGMSVGEVRQVLRRAPSLARFKSKVAGSRPVLSAQARTVARTYLLGVDFFSKVAPMLIEATGFILGTWNQAKDAERRAARRLDIEAHLKKEAQKLADLYLQGDAEKKVEGWLSLAGELQDTIEEVRLRQQQEWDGRQEAQSELSKNEQALRSLLDDHPEGR